MVHCDFTSILGIYRFNGAGTYFLKLSAVVLKALKLFLIADIINLSSNILNYSKQFPNLISFRNESRLKCREPI
jgi:hypothetical protein